MQAQKGKSNLRIIRYYLYHYGILYILQKDEKKNLSMNGKTQILNYK